MNNLQAKLTSSASVLVFKITNDNLALIQTIKAEMDLIAPRDKIHVLNQMIDFDFELFEEKPKVGGLLDLFIKFSQSNPIEVGRFQQILPSTFAQLFLFDELTDIKLDESMAILSAADYDGSEEWRIKNHDRFQKELYIFLQECLAWVKSVIKINAKQCTLQPPVIQHHPKPNIIKNWRTHGEDVISFIEYPSFKILFDDVEEIIKILDALKIKCVFTDGDSLIIPSYYQNLIDWLVLNFQGHVLDDNYGKRFEFVTLAIKSGLDGELVELGHSIFGFDGTAQEMLEKALRSPNQAIDDWNNLYQRSMMPV